MAWRAEGVSGQAPYYILFIGIKGTLLDSLFAYTDRLLDSLFTYSDTLLYLFRHATLLIQTRYCTYSDTLLDSLFTCTDTLLFAICNDIDTLLYSFFIHSSMRYLHTPAHSTLSAPT